MHIVLKKITDEEIDQNRLGLKETYREMIFGMCEGRKTVKLSGGGFPKGLFYMITHILGQH
jgi:hypothetical protein